MKNAPKFYPRDFENAIFNLLSADSNINSIYFNHLLENLYEKYKPMAQISAAKYRLDKDLADDILHESLILLILRIRANRFVFNPQIGFKSFISQTLKFLCFNINKKYHHYSLDPLENTSNELLIDNPADFELKTHSTSNYTLTEKIEEIINANTSQQGAKVLKLSFLEHKSNEEGAELMGYKNESIFRKKKSQHLRKLRNQVEPALQKVLHRLAG